MVEIGIRNPLEEQLIELFKRDVTYFVPPFQREYAWKKDDWSDFLEDIQKVRDKDRGHFFGFMTFRREGKDRIAIIEGQQRFSTVTILIAVVRDTLNVMGDSSWTKIEQPYIKSDDVFSPDSPTAYKLTLSEIDKDFFRKYIQELGDPQKKIAEANGIPRLLPSNQLIIDCYSYFYNELVNGTANLSEGEKRKYLKETLNSVMKKFIAITWEVADEKSAYNIFQTLNDRGVALSQADLLKIYLLDRAEDDWKEAKERWDEIRETLGTEDVNVFLRHYWLSAEGVVKQQDLLGEIHTKITSRKEVFKFLETLREEAEKYDSLLSLTQDYWDKKDSRIVEMLKELQVLSKRQTLPLLMAGIGLHTSEFLKLIEYCIAFTFRYLTIAEAENKVLERLFSDLAIDIRKSKVTKAPEIRERLKRDYIVDDQFKTTFARKEIKTNKVAKYILGKIELNLSGEQETLSKTLTLEHVLPVKVNEEWKKYLKKMEMNKDEYVYRLGNMTLLVGKVNKEAQNYFFERKRDDFYSKMTRLKINESLKKIKSWSQREIDERQNELAETATKVWKL